MTNVMKRNITVAIALFVAGATLIITTPYARAEETTTESASEVVKDEAVNAAEAVESAKASSAEASTFVAQKGDSYTKMARKAVQIFGIDNKVDLSGAQIVFVETNITQVAGSLELNLGESVSISKATIGEWVEKAKQLTDGQKALWQVYANRVDFNTNNVGEAR